MVVPTKGMEDKKYYTSVYWKEKNHKSKIENYFEKGLLELYNSKGEKIFYRVNSGRSIAYV